MEFFLGGVKESGGRVAFRCSSLRSAQRPDWSPQSAAPVISLSLLEKEVSRLLPRPQWRRPRLRKLRAVQQRHAPTLFARTATTLVPVLGFVAMRHPIVPAAVSAGRSASHSVNLAPPGSSARRREKAGGKKCGLALWLGAMKDTRGSIWGDQSAPLLSSPPPPRRHVSGVTS